MLGSEEILDLDSVITFITARESWPHDPRTWRRHMDHMDHYPGRIGSQWSIILESEGQVRLRYLVRVHASRSAVR